MKRGVSAVSPVPPSLPLVPRPVETAIPWLGLRAQIVFALCLMFLLLFGLLGFATVQISRRSALAEQVRAERLLERVLSPAWAALGQGEPEALHGACNTLRSRLGDVRVLLTRPDGSRFSCGGELKPAHGVALTGGGWLTIRLPDGAEQSTRSVSRLLLFYMGLTGLCVVLVCYVLLTHLIVRPLERLTHSAEQFAHGALHGPVPEGGSAETVSLSRTFNRMAALLAAERTALIDRLAELERTTRDLQSAQKQLIHGEKLASVGRLAAGVAHEIGNPLTAIAGLIELLQSGDLSADKQREFLSRIAAETERINGIIRDLLDYARHDSADEAAERCELRAAIDDAVNLLRPQKALRSVAIVVSVPPGLVVVGARARLTQVVLNLLLNASDAISGAIFSHGRIEIKAVPDEAGDYVLLSVRDDGPGIAPEIAQRLFEPFSTTKPPGKGTGLGLAVSHAIVEGLGGSIRAANQQGGGACFELRLPRAVKAATRAV